MKHTVEIYCDSMFFNPTRWEAVAAGTGLSADAAGRLLLGLKKAAPTCEFRVVADRPARLARAEEG